MRQAVIGFAILTVVYIGALAWADARSNVFSLLPRLVATLPTLAFLSLATYGLRYARWHWLLARAGSRIRVVEGFMAYIAGFAFTATPGKVGELLRIRYLSPLGTPPDRVVAAFIVERTADLVVVLLLASLAITRRDLFVLAVAFVGTLIVALLLLATHPTILRRVAAVLRAAGTTRVAILVDTACDALETARGWMHWTDLAGVLALGALSWSIASASFVWLIGEFGVDLPFRVAFAIFPLAMLAGAASMLPGGIGSTEAVIVALLVLQGVPGGTATLAAVGIRLSSLWFAILCGLISVVILEWQRRAALRDVTGPGACIRGVDDSRES